MNTTKVNILFLALCLIVLSACSKEDEIPMNQTLECIGEPDIPTFSTVSCENFPTLDSLFICNVIFSGNFELQDEGKHFMPQYCADVGDQISYKNTSGEEIKFSVINKSFHPSAVMLNTFRPCEGDSTKSIGFCLEGERISLTLQAAAQDIQLIIALGIIPDIQVATAGNIGEQLTITRQRETSFFAEFNAIVNSRTLSFEQSFNQEFHTQLELLGTTHSNVFSNNVEFFISNPFKYFYTSELGLIGFIDDSGETWALN